jgi:predicted transcriptional regulator
MNNLAVRVSRETHEKLRQMAAEQCTTMQTILDKAVESYRRERFFADANASVEALRADPVAWGEYRTDLAGWEATLMDGLPPGERWDAERSGGGSQPKRKKRRA